MKLSTIASFLVTGVAFFSVGVSTSYRGKACGDNGVSCMDDTDCCGKLICADLEGKPKGYRLCQVASAVAKSTATAKIPALTSTPTCRSIGEICDTNSDCCGSQECINTFGFKKVWRKRCIDVGGELFRSSMPAQKQDGCASYSQPCGNGKECCKDLTCQFFRRGVSLCRPHKSRLTVRFDGGEEKCLKQNEYCYKSEECCKGLTCQYISRLAGTALGWLKWCKPVQQPAKYTPRSIPVPVAVDSSNSQSVCSNEHDFCDNTHPCCGNSPCKALPNGGLSTCEPVPTLTPEMEPNSLNGNSICSNEHDFCDLKHPCCDNRVCVPLPNDGISTCDPGPTPAPAPTPKSKVSSANCFGPFPPMANWCDTVADCCPGKSCQFDQRVGRKVCI